ncbi:glycosyltransferase [Sphingobacterium corticibacter]|uniref:Glycosyltransferase n=1 Tax=Sphingobacterium corticibacter TaxID=2171749 RepID=A0A2T8HJH6_9SPHI|nr:glycosyltransferase [Sphingobacterium corticibacter]PVH25607.1 hypothetical protein DC487_06600 [Sphingobacterium corticibacter]
MEKITVFTPSLNIGGIERVLNTYAKGLAEKGYPVTYLTVYSKGELDIVASDNLEYQHLGTKRLRDSLFALVRYFRNNRPDIVFVANDATLIVYVAKLLSGVSFKIISSQHNYYDIYAKVGVKQTFVAKYIFPLCFKVVAVSEGIRSMLIKNFHLKADRVVKIYNPIDLSLINKYALDPVCDLPQEYLLFVGRFEKVKNIPLLLDAFSKFHQAYSNVKLLLIGGGPEEQFITSYIQELGLENAVKNLGIKSNPFPYINNAKVIVLSSISEAFPTVLLESLSLGKTIVSTPTLGAIDILKHGKYGYISASLDNPNDLFCKLANAYNTPLNQDVLKKYAESNYDLRTRVAEFERLWKVF